MSCLALCISMDDQNVIHAFMSKNEPPRASTVAHSGKSLFAMITRQLGVQVQVPAALSLKKHAANAPVKVENHYPLLGPCHAY